MIEHFDILITVIALVTFQRYAEEEKLERMGGNELRRNTSVVTCATPYQHALV